MNVLLLGSGGREHAIAWKLSQSKKLTKLYVAPGNPGIADIAECINIAANQFYAISSFCVSQHIGMIIVGPEAPLVEGLVDFFKQTPEVKHIPIIGPNRSGAMLEGSKDFAKEFMVKYQIPTAQYKTITKYNLEEGLAFLKTLTPPYVLKADGLAAGKGVIITSDLLEASNTLTQMLEGMFGEASNKVVIEEFLDGIELSAFALFDGQNYLILPEAKDYKRIGVADTGPNTGGMGSISPVPFATEAFMQKVENRIIRKTLEGLIKENIDYCGFIFVGLMNVKGEPYVIEYNVRMGDPETESIMPRIESDLLEIFEACSKRKLNETKLQISPKTAATVMLVSGGYPGSYSTGYPIEFSESTESIVFHAGTKKDGENINTQGGRVLAVCSMGNNMADALKKTYHAIEGIKFRDMYYRTDIGFDL